MRFILTSDWHLREKNPICRLDDITQTQILKLGYIFEYANNHDMPILQSGDFFDKPRGYYILQEVIKLINLYPDLKIYAIAGQHDLYLRTNQSSNLNILNNTGYIKKLDENPTFLKDSKLEVALYGCSWDQNIPKIALNCNVNILVIHAPIAFFENDFLNHIEHNKASKFLKKYKDFDLILCGDIHQKFICKQNNRIICNSGPLLRLSADEHIIKHKPGFFVYDAKNKTIEWINIPCESSSEIITTEHLEYKKELSTMLENFICNIKNESSFEGIDIIKSLRKIIDEKNVQKEIRNILAELIINEE